MPRAEVGSLKHLNNKLKSKGLQRLRWYCQVCEKQCRDENGFKCHTQSESHVRNMQLVGENAHKFINDFSNQFKSDFLQLLRTSHGEKAVHINHFYQTYISNKEHVHMNSTKWPSLTEFAKYLGREAICRVTEDEKGLYIAWIDSSPEAMRRQAALRKKERQDRGDEEREQRMIEDQVKKAQKDAEAKAKAPPEEEARALQRVDGEKISLNFDLKSAVASKPPTPPSTADTLSEINNSVPDAPIKITLSASSTKPKNVFAHKKSVFAGKKVTVKEQPKKMSEAERIMREELEAKRKREEASADRGPKRMKM
ncbi:hypothetical protein EJ05DRAFT_467233 [Pseudovirgaria hyperparasitica]|uniref:C2H2-type domain-containing protein n=1 Tax=Pseudovirgaria hyperparasitica TaxID=470096 RepID=A0A6A6VZX3_9PEZI|nr:uncharacterized protein EJ05DRAFT_467233 [Pseudovirgaria hyperparasitica]KAF2755843.1 hypothetical protein EJ05DRAFT_467233 [Pseudovirgaria hyperparasitica]